MKTNEKETAKLKEQIEKDLIQQLKSNPSIIADIEKPTQIVRNYAVNYFTKKYAHPVSLSTPVSIKDNVIKEIKTEFEKDLINQLKNQPTIIKDIPNPTMTIRNYAVAYFAQKYSK